MLDPQTSQFVARVGDTECAAVRYVIARERYRVETGASKCREIRRVRPGCRHVAVHFRASSRMRNLEMANRDVRCRGERGNAAEPIIRARLGPNQSAGKE